MTSRERVLTALKRQTPDRVPWMEGIVENGIASAVCGGYIISSSNSLTDNMKPENVRAISEAIQQSGQYSGGRGQ